MAARLLPLLAFVVLPRLAAAQGVTTAAMQGTVGGEGAAIAGATVRVVNLSNGRRWEVATASDGRFFLEDVAIGGPYRIEVAAVGFAPEVGGGIVLTLGQRLVVDFMLRPAVIELSPVSVTTTADPVLNSGRTGPAEVVLATTIAALPNPGRDFVTLTLLSPQAAFSPSPPGLGPSSGIAIGGQNRLLNSFQIDGGLNHDLYLGRLPGRLTLPRPVSLEALEDIQILAAPFDVRHGAFAGGLVNAVTKSGTNAAHGSVFGFLTDGGLVGKGSAGDKAGDFTAWQWGGSVGGPIVRDRAHYFLSVDLQHRVVPDPGPVITDTAGGADTVRVGISYASAVQFQNILRDTFGLDPGTLGPVDGRVPAGDVFGKISVQLGTNSHLEVSHHYTYGNRWESLPREYGSYILSSSAAQFPARAHASRLIWTALLKGHWSNALIVSHLRLHDECRPSVTYPFVDVLTDRGTLLAGPGTGCLTDTLSQDAFEVTENVTLGLGGHVVTLGAHGERLRFEDAAMGNAAGWWRFSSLDSLAAGRAYRYQRTLAGPLRSGGVDFRVRELALYAQDRWTPTPRLTVTAGLRVDMAFLPDASATNDSLEAALGIDTGRLPSGTPLLSPRLGINYDLAGEGRTFLRGGVGLFSGRPPYRWLGNAYRDGTQQVFLLCTGASVPVFDPIKQPTTCAGGAGPTPQPSFWDPDVRSPQNLKVALGVDHRLSGGVIGTVDVLYTRAVHQLYFNDVNLLPPTALAQGEGNRPLYGTISARGIATPAYRDAAFGQVVQVSNRSGDHAVSLSVQLRKRFGNGVKGGVLYAHTRARDRMSLATYGARPGLADTPLDGTLQDRRLGTSLFEIRHRLLIDAAARLPYGMRLSLLYGGASGPPFTYAISGDANADGIGRAGNVNDAVYVPRDSLDIALFDPTDWARLDAFIRDEPCLRQHRGQIVARNSCRNPWFGTLNVRLTKALPTVTGQSLELTADLYNVLNLINPRWGQQRETTPRPTAGMLRLVGYDAAAGRGIYRLTLPTRNQIQDLASRWQVELSVRYVF